MRKNKLFMYALLPALGFGFFGVNVASAHFFGGKDLTPAEIATRQTEMFTQTASMLGLSVDTVKNAWAEGKGIKELAEENGITEETLKTKMEAARKEKMKQHVQALVDQGVITQAQADKRLQAIESGKGEKKMGKRGGHMGGFGF